MARKKGQTKAQRLRSLKHEGRLRSARMWLATQKDFTRIGRSYRKRYGVDWECAIKELQSLGVKLDQTWIEGLRRSLAGAIESRRMKKEAGRSELAPWQSAEFAYIAGYTSGGAAYGVTWEEWEETPPLQRTQTQEPHFDEIHGNEPDFPEVHCDEPLFQEPPREGLVCDGPQILLNFEEVF